MFDHLLESSRWDDYNKWSNTGFGQEINVLEMKIRALSGALMLCLSYVYFEELVHDRWHECVWMCMSVLCWRGGCMFSVAFLAWACSYLFQIRCVFFISIMPISLLNLMFDRLLESALRDDSNKRSNLEFGEGIKHWSTGSVNGSFTHLIWLFE